MKTEFRLFRLRHGVELCTLTGAFGCRSLFAVYWDGHVGQIDLLFIHLWDYMREL